MAFAIAIIPIPVKREKHRLVDKSCVFISLVIFWKIFIFLCVWLIFWYIHINLFDKKELADCESTANCQNTNQGFQSACMVYNQLPCNGKQKNFNYCSGSVADEHFYKLNAYNQTQCLAEKGVEPFWDYQVAVENTKLVYQ